MRAYSCWARQQACKTWHARLTQQSGASSIIGLICTTSAMQFYHSQARGAASITGTLSDHLGHAEMLQLAQRGHLLLDAWHHAHHRDLLDDWQLRGHAPDGRGLLAAGT